MSKKNIARKFRRRPELLNEIMSSAAPSQINRQYEAARKDLPELLSDQRSLEPGRVGCAWVLPSRHGDHDDQIKASSSPFPAT